LPVLPAQAADSRIAADEAFEIMANPGRSDFAAPPAEGRKGIVMTSGRAEGRSR